MPPRDVRAWLSDIADACGVILECTAGKAPDQYAQDVVVRSAVERQFEIIGEAMRRLLAAEPSLELRLPEAREVIDFRNFLAHAYHLVQHQEVWKIVERDVPVLKKKAEAILRERGG